MLSEDVVSKIKELAGDRDLHGLLRFADSFTQLVWTEGSSDVFYCELEAEKEPYGQLVEFDLKKGVLSFLCYEDSFLEEKENKPIVCSI
jgi:hypothetical protein